MVPDFVHGAPPTDACAAFIEESRMKFVNARELDRKSGCTLGRTWGTRPEPKTVDEPIALRVENRGIPHLAKNERDMGHPSSVDDMGCQSKGESGGSNLRLVVGTKREWSPILLGDGDHSWLGA